MEATDDLSGPSFALGGRLALVTGGGRGLGRSIAIALAAAGADLVVAARSGPQLAEVKRLLESSGVTCHAVTADLSTPSAAEELASAVNEDFGPVDIVVHAAGVQARKPAFDIEWKEWNELMTVNVTSAFFLSRSLMRRQMPDHPVARHLFVTSLTSSIGIANTSAYTASKSAAMGVVRALAVEWAPLGVTVNAIQPGYFRTALTEAVFSDPERRAWIESRIPMGRVGTGADLGGASVFLSSDAANYITGQAIAVDGGWLAS
jgi:2-deoxy-D-gluconate 3-dehydrogenase